MTLRAGSLSGSFSPIAAGSNVDLTIAGKLDWVHWGLYTDTSIDRKQGVTPQISNYSAVNTNIDTNSYVFVYQYGDNANGYTWHDGSPTAAVTNTTTGVWVYSWPSTAVDVGAGFQITAPADTTERVLEVFVGAFAARGRLEASLSDDSAAGYLDTSLFNSPGNGPGGVYSLRYRADSAGQTLTVRWTLYQRAPGPNLAEANVTLQAAALTANTANNPPFVTLTNPPRASAFAAPASLTLGADAVDFDGGTITNLTFHVGATGLGQKTSAPFTMPWNNVPAGRYFLTAVASDDQGGSRASAPVEVFVYGSGGNLSGGAATPPGSVDLTSEGTTDWTHWGLNSATDFDVKSGIPRQISNFTALGTNEVQRLTNTVSYSWSDGSPTAFSPGTTTGVFIEGSTNGFMLTAPADSNPRTLRLYLGGYGVQAYLESWLSDFSAAPFIDSSSVSNVLGNTDVEYTLNYSAASSGQELIVVYRTIYPFDSVFGNVTLQSATLQGGPALPHAIVLLSPSMNGGLFSFSFNSEPGQTYTVSFTPSLSAPNWQTLTNLQGTGSPLTVTDDVAASQRFYRVTRP